MSGLYVHIPFCRRKCRYCDFTSYSGKEDVIDAYISAVIQEAGEYRGQKAETVFIGGGTPSLLSAAQFTRLINGIRANVEVLSDAEFTVECNPDSVSAEKLTAYRDNGVNRLSIGLQSAKDSELKLLGRIHSYSSFLSAYQTAAAVFKNINIDIISGLPGQVADDFLYTLNTVKGLSPQHISAYSLIVEPDTPLYNDVAAHKLQMPSEDTDRDIYKLTAQVLAPQYTRYEISNYSLPGYQCRHNIGYWTGKDYIGLGCAAHSLFNGYRYCNTGSLQSYIMGKGRGQQRYKLTQADRLEEFFMLRLRLKTGCELSEYKRLFNGDLLIDKAAQLSQLKALGLINISDKSVSLTEKGCDLADAVILKLI